MKIHFSRLSDCIFFIFLPVLMPQLKRESWKTAMKTGIKIMLLLFKPKEAMAQMLSAERAAESITASLQSICFEQSLSHFSGELSIFKKPILYFLSLRYKRLCFIIKSPGIISRSEDTEETALYGRKESMKLPAATAKNAITKENTESTAFDDVLIFMSAEPRARPTPKASAESTRESITHLSIKKPLFVFILCLYTYFCHRQNIIKQVQFFAEVFKMKILLIICIVFLFFVIGRVKEESNSAVFIDDIDDVIKRYEIVGFADKDGKKVRSLQCEKMMKCLFSAAACFDEEKLYEAVVNLSQRLSEKQKFCGHTHIKECRGRGNVRRFMVFDRDKPFYVDFMAVIDEKKRKKIKKLKNIGVEVYAADSRKSNFVISVAKRCAIHYENDICIKGEEIRLLNREELHEAVKICRLFSECGVKENQNIKNAVKEEFSLVSLDEINTEREVIKYLFKNTQCFLALSCILSCVCLAADVLFKEM